MLKNVKILKNGDVIFIEGKIYYGIEIEIEEKCVRHKDKNGKVSEKEK